MKLKHSLYGSFLAVPAFLVLLLNLTNSSTFAVSKYFTDVKYTHPNINAIQYLQDNNTLIGYEDGTFRPDNQVTRAEFLKIVILNSHYQIGGENCFKDVKNEWFAPYICAAADAGLVEGYEDGNFRPHQTVNFAEASKIIANAFNFNLDVPTSDNEWYKPYVSALEDKKAIPYDISSFNQNITRSITAEMVWRVALQRTYKVSNTYENITAGLVASEANGDFKRFKSCEAMHDFFVDNTSPVTYISPYRAEYLANTPANAIPVANSMSEKGGCFTGETKILMADGSYKEIQDIHEKDLIATLSDKDSSELVKAPVVGTVKHLVPGYLLINNFLEVTPEHILFSNDEWKTASEVKEGDYLLNKDGTKISVYSIEYIKKPTWVYNFEVKGYHTYIANGIYVHNDKGDSVDYSSTNLQEEKVDEADFVKNDGKYIYIIKGGEVRVIEAYPAESMKELDAITFADEKFYPSEMYLQDNQLVVVGKARAGTYYQGFDTKSVDPEYYYDGGSAKVYVFDISNKANIKIKREVSFEGEYSSSRMIDGVVYLTVTQNNYYQPWSKNHAWKEADLVPLYLENGKLDKLVSCKDINYMPESVNDSNFLILAGVPTDPKKPISSEVVMGGSGITYSSTKNFYIAKSKYSQYGYYRNSLDDSKTFIYKFGLNDGTVNYKSMGVVPGTALNQFSMDEYRGNFRIATTLGDVWDTDKLSTNNVYILDSKMNQIGALEKMAPGEKIYSVRFVDGRGYVVTFKKVDPLFVIGLDEPTNPKVLGYLKIPGFSDYLHPYDENHIIGFGMDTATPTDEEIEARGIDFAWFQGIKVALFDVRNVAKPKELYKEIIGDRGTASPLTYDHKALLYSRTKGLNGGHLMAFPIAVAEIPEETKNDPNTPGNTYGEINFQGAYVYDVSPKNGFKLRGKITQYTDDDELVQKGWRYYGDNDIKRIIYIGDNFYTISNSAVLASKMTSPLEPVKLLELSEL